MIITQTPLRLSFFGGNTDFPDFYKKHGGCVLTTAIDKYIYCIITERFDDKIYINWSKKEIVDSVDEIEHELAREALRKLKITKGIEITFLADIPSEGSGLGSSSSVLVGLLNALHHYKGDSVSALQLAQEAVEIELYVLNKPIGIQDQYIAAFGGIQTITFHQDDTVKTERIEWSKGEREDLDNHLMLFYTGLTRKAGTILETVKREMGQEEKTQALLQTKELVMQGKLAFQKMDIQKIGKLLHQGWTLKKSLAGTISNDHIDAMYQKALESGALGGKIAGAGGGGFLLIVVPGEKRQHVREALREYQEMPFRLERDGSKVIFNVRRY